jgi:hypothetical protein
MENHRKISNANETNLLDAMLNKFFAHVHVNRHRPIEPTLIGSLPPKFPEPRNGVDKPNASDEQGHPIDEFHSPQNVGLCAIPGIHTEPEMMKYAEDIGMEFLNTEFDEELESLSRTWMYDWILDLKDSEIPDKTRNYFWNGQQARILEGAKTVKLIREELQTIQTNMVRHFLSRWNSLVTFIPNSDFSAYLDLAGQDCKGGQKPSQINE